ncbi:MAG TPA: EAL domain-containing protein [Actinomycetota bacterium]|nr:EAL domain-containing protein [Actinomycetota bacterium]
MQTGKALKQKNTARRFRQLIAPVIAAGVALVVAATISSSYGSVIRRWEAQQVVESMEGTIRGLDGALDATSEGGAVAEAEEEWAEVQEQMQATTHSLRDVPRLAATDVLRNEMREYGAYVEGVLSRLRSGDGEGAAQLVETHGSARFDAFDDAIEESLTALGNDGIRSQRRAGLTATIALVAAAAITTFLITQIARARRRNELRSAHESGVRKEQQKFTSLVQRASDMITIFDRDGQIVYDSPSVERILGFKSILRIGADAHRFAHPDDVRALLDRFSSSGSSGAAPRALEFRHKHADGTWRWVECTVADVSDDPAIGGFVANYRVIDERKMLEESLKRQAFHDPLTDLANRALFRHRVAAFLAAPDRSLGSFALLFLDVDDFKTVNDSLGHQAGDDLLIEIARRLRSCVRVDDTVARLGGDEFALLVTSDTNTDQFVQVAERLLQAMKEPFVVGKQILFVHCSIGVAVDDCRDRSADDLIRDADIAMYTAKARGKERFVVFAPEMRSSIRWRVDLESELRRALDQGEFRLYYQPIVALDTGRPYAMEALIRWEHPERGLLAPSEFLSVAEASGLIVPIGEWVLREACAQLRTWQGTPETADIGVTVNVSARQLAHAGFIEFLGEVVGKADIDRAGLVIEITETALLEDTEAVASQLRDVHALGIRIAVDDFGTGYSSLAHLRTFPMDILKIDKDFVDGLTLGAEDAAITQAIVKLARTFKLVTIAEGIEAVEQRAMLEQMGCEMAQGYLIARPLPKAEADRFVRERADSRTAFSGASQPEAHSTSDVTNATAASITAGSRVIAP